jgi:hypothetical protein
MIAIVDDLDDHDAVLIHLLTMTEPNADKGHAMALAFLDIHEARNYRHIPAKEKEAA